MLTIEGQKRTAADWLGKEEDLFDQWLERSLHEAFDAVTQEPIPDDILRLIELVGLHQVAQGENGAAAPASPARSPEVKRTRKPGLLSCIPDREFALGQPRRSSLEFAGSQ